MLADLQTLEKAIPRLEKEVKGKKADKAVLDAAVAAQKLLGEGITLHAGAAKAGIDVPLLRELTLMTSKPFIFGITKSRRINSGRWARTASSPASPSTAVWTW